MQNYIIIRLGLKMINNPELNAADKA